MSYSSKSAAMDISCVWPAGRLLGEGPWWCERSQAVYWVDIKNPAILRYTPASGSRDIWPCSEQIGAFVPRRSGGFVGAFRSGIYAFDLNAPGSAVVQKFIAAPEGFATNDRFNDAKCHPDGSFWAGTMDDTENNRHGWFYRLSLKHELRAHFGPLMVCNGPAFSNDGAIGYFTDSASRTIYAQRLEADKSPQALIRFPGEYGYPDGMCVDTEGNLWVALWDGWKVARISPSGKFLTAIDVPVQRPTSCCFGGPDLNTLYITSASIGLENPGPLDGGLFEVKLMRSRGSVTNAYSG